MGRALLSLLIGLLAIGCSAGESLEENAELAYDTPVDLSEAQAILGVPLAFPTYVPPGLNLREWADVSEDPLAVTLTYLSDGSAPEEEQVLSFVFITQSREDGRELPDTGRLIEADGTAVRYVDMPYGELQHLLVAEWKDGTRYFNAAFLGSDGVDGSAVRAEALAMIRGTIAK